MSWPHRRFRLFAGLHPLVVAWSVAAWAAAQQDVPTDQSGDPLVVATRDTCVAVIRATYDDTLAAGETFRKALDSFASNPTDDGLAKARAAWIDARRTYSLTEAFRFSGGPIDAADGPELRLNAWPVDEACLDEVEGSGVIPLVSDVERVPVIDAARLARENFRTGEKNVTCGWHAIEFMLWGVDRSVEGPGNRPVSDFTTAPFAARRCDFLRAAAAQLVADLRLLPAAWADGKPGNHGASFHALPADDAVRSVVKGMVMLAGFELAGERLGVPLDTREQEEEQSCFSDTTHLDLQRNVQGLVNLWRGRVTRLDGTQVAGTSLSDLTRLRDAALAERLTALLDACATCAAEGPAPFDRVITAPADSPEHAAAVRLQAALEKFSNELKQFAARLGKPFDPAEFAG